jgi:hypothetical protein
MDDEIINNWRNLTSHLINLKKDSIVKKEEFERISKIKSRLEKFARAFVKSRTEEKKLSITEQVEIFLCGISDETERSRMRTYYLSSVTVEINPAVRAQSSNPYGYVRPY